MESKSKKTRVFWVIFSLCGFSLLLGTSLSMAADYPTKPIRLIIQFVPGTTTDIIARKLADVVAKDLGQPFIPENKPGGGGTLGVAEIVRSKADGYTVGCINMPTLTINPHMQTLPYDPFKDIAHICVISPYEYALYVKTDAPWKSFEDFVDYARKNPGKATYGTPGVGNTSHLLMISLGKKVNVDWRHVPYKGDGEIIPAILGGHLDAAVGSPAAVVPQVKGGTLRLLVVTSKNRWPYIPEVPTLLEKGYDLFQASFLSLGVRAGTPEPIRQKLEAAFKKAVQDPALNREFEEKIYAKLTYISGAEYGQFIKDQFFYYKDFLKTIGLTK